MCVLIRPDFVASGPRYRAGLLESSEFLELGRVGRCRRRAARVGGDGGLFIAAQRDVLRTQLSDLVLPKVRGGARVGFGSVGKREGGATAISQSSRIRPPGFPHASNSRYIELYTLK